MFRFIRNLLLIAAAIAIGPSSVRNLANSSQGERPYSLVILNARIVDGAGNPWYRSDIAIKGGRIINIGRIDRSEAGNVIDAGGQIVAPGFIDVHTHVESIYSLPEAENFVRMGVTSLVTGNCGTSVTDVGQFLARFDKSRSQ